MKSILLTLTEGVENFNGHTQRVSVLRTLRKDTANAQLNALVNSKNRPWQGVV